MSSILYDPGRYKDLTESFMAATRAEPDPAPACPVADCPLHVDVVVRAADGVGFGAHTANLLKYSDAFPGVEAPAAHGRGAVIRLSESADVVDLLLRFMHGGRQPALSALAVDTLAALAATVERYQVYSAVELCKAHMSLIVDTHPVDVFVYAVKHTYAELAAKAAQRTLTKDSADLVAKAAQAQIAPALIVEWFRYRDAWADALRALVTTPPSAGASLHKGGVEECPLWIPFRREVVLRVGVTLDGLVNLEDTIRAKAAVLLVECVYCSKRAGYWAHLVGAAHAARACTFDLGGGVQ